MKTYATCFLLLLVAACRREYDVRLPSTEWAEFSAPDALRLPGAAAARMEGVYTCTDGSADFGSNAVLKWSYDAVNGDTTIYVSLFCERDVAWIVCSGKRRDSTILLNGFWRKMAGTANGRVRLSIAAGDGGAFFLGGATAPAIRVEGVYGDGEAVPERPLRFTWARALAPQRPLEVVVHRGGGQSADLLPASENSLEILPWAARFGATGVEIDVRQTKDGVLVLYHDATLNERLIQKNGLVGPIENYSYAQLNTLVRLIRNGERIPTLRAALETILTRTPLRFVWLDTKFDAPIGELRSLQIEFQQRAAAMGKPLEIVIGIPDEAARSRLVALPDFRTVPSLVELDTDVAESVNARIWAPRWTLGLQNDKVAQMQAQGRRAFVWTLDLPENIGLFLRQGRFDGILSNYPTAVTYAYYTQP